MHARALDEFCRGVESILRELHPAGADLEVADALAEFRGALAVVSDPESHDLEDSPGGSVSRADALRIRASKFIAAQLPAGAFAEPAVRRRIREAVRALATAALGELAPSAYLDAPGRREAE